MNLIQALRSPGSQAVMTNIAQHHYNQLYNIAIQNITFGIHNPLQTRGKGYTRTYRLLYLDYASAIYDAANVTVFTSNGIDALSSSFSGCYMASFTSGGNRYVAHIPMPGSKTIWNQAVLNGNINNVVLFKLTEGVAVPKLTGIWGIITYNNRCFQLDVDEKAPPLLGHRVFISMPRPPILTEINPIPGGLIP